MSCHNILCIDLKDIIARYDCLIIIPFFLILILNLRYDYAVTYVLTLRLIFLCYQVDVVTASSRTQVNQVNQELEIYKERSAALENSLRNRILALECSVETNLEEQVRVKESNGADDSRVKSLERTCEELRQGLVESQLLFNNMQTITEAEKDALTVEKDDLMSKVAELVGRTAGLSDALAVAQGMLSEVRIHAQPVTHSADKVGEVQVEGTEDGILHTAGAVPTTDLEVVEHVQLRSGE